MEVFKNIEGFENYQISSLGNVKGLEVITRFGSTFKKYPERLVNHWKDKKGYCYVTFVVNGKNRHFTIHRLVAKAFIINKYKKPQVNHIDGNKGNNVVSNLEWMTSKENIKHAKETGLMNNSGVNNYNSKLSVNDISEIRVSKLTQKEISVKYKICQTGVSKIKLNKTYKNVGI